MDFRQRVEEMKKNYSFKDKKKDKGKLRERMLGKKKAKKRKALTT